MRCGTRHQARGRPLYTREKQLCVRYHGRWFLHLLPADDRVLDLCVLLYTYTDYHSQQWRMSWAAAQRKAGQCGEACAEVDKGRVEYGTHKAIAPRCVHRVLERTRSFPPGHSIRKQVLGTKLRRLQYRLQPRKHGLVWKRLDLCRIGGAPHFGAFLEPLNSKMVSWAVTAFVRPVSFVSMSTFRPFIPSRMRIFCTLQCV